MEKQEKSLFSEKTGSDKDIHSKRKEKEEEASDSRTKTHWRDSNDNTSD